jgi:hypothetical protein
VPTDLLSTQSNKNDDDRCAVRDMELQQTNVDGFPHERYFILTNLAKSNAQPTTTKVVNIM